MQSMRMTAPGVTGVIGLGRLKKSKEKQVNCYSLEPTKTQKVVIEGQLQKVRVYIAFSYLDSSSMFCVGL